MMDALVQKSIKAEEQFSPYNSEKQHNGYSMLLGLGYQYHCNNYLVLLLCIIVIQCK
jgi:hypothetical protein